MSRFTREAAARRPPEHPGGNSAGPHPTVDPPGFSATGRLAALPCAGYTLARGVDRPGDCLLPRRRCLTTVTEVMRMRLAAGVLAGSRPCAGVVPPGARRFRQPSWRRGSMCTWASGSPSSGATASSTSTWIPSEPRCTSTDTRPRRLYADAARGPHGVVPGQRPSRLGGGEGRRRPPYQSQADSTRPLLADRCRSSSSTPPPRPALAGPRSDQADGAGRPRDRSIIRPCGREAVVDAHHDVCR